MKKTFEEVLKENQEKMRTKRKEEIERMKREKTKETILTIFIGLLIVSTTLFILNNLDNKMIEDCTNAGHSQYYCEKGIE